MTRTILLCLALSGVAAAQVTDVKGGRRILGSYDASGATRSLPDRQGTGSPNARDNCTTVGESYFQTDAAAGSRLWRCSGVGTPGTWTHEAGPAGANGADGAAGVGVVGCLDTSGSTAAYSCTPSTSVTEYFTGLTVSLIPQTAGAGGSMTINISGLGAKALKQWDGSTNPTASDFRAGKGYLISYDGTVFRQISTGTQPVVASWNTGTASCTTTGGGSCTAVASGGVSGLPIISVTHSFGTSQPVVSCWDSSGIRLGPQAAASEIDERVTSVNIVAITISVSTSGTCKVFNGDQGAAGVVVTSAGVGGPGSATDGHLALFDGASGGLIKDGGAIQTPPTYNAAGNSWVPLFGPSPGSTTNNIAGGSALKIAFWTINLPWYSTFTTSSKVWFFVNTVNSTSCGGSTANCAIRFWILDPTLATVYGTGSKTGLTSQGGAAAPFDAGFSLNPGTYVIAAATDSTTVLLQAGWPASTSSWYGVGQQGLGIVGNRIRFGVCQNNATGLAWPGSGCGTPATNASSSATVPALVLEY